MGDLIEFPTKYVPTFEESRRLEGLQRMISGWRMELIAEWDKLRLNYGQRMLSKQRFHNGVRENWQIFTGFQNQVYFLKKSK